MQKTVEIWLIYVVMYFIVSKRNLNGKKIIDFLYGQ